MTAWAHNACCYCRSGTRWQVTVGIRLTPAELDQWRQIPSATGELAATIRLITALDDPLAEISLPARGLLHEVQLPDDLVCQIDTYLNRHGLFSSARLLRNSALQVLASSQPTIADSAPCPQY